MLNSQYGEGDRDVKNIWVPEITFLLAWSQCCSSWFNKLSHKSNNCKQKPRYVRGLTTGTSPRGMFLHIVSLKSLLPDIKCIHYGQRPNQSGLYKVECVFPMVIWPGFRMGQCREDDHRKDAPHFMMWKMLTYDPYQRFDLVWSLSNHLNSKAFKLDSYIF